MKDLPAVDGLTGLVSSPKYLQQSKRISVSVYSRELIPSHRLSWQGLNPVTLAYNPGQMDRQPH